MTSQITDSPGGIDHIFRKQIGNTVLVLDPSFYAYAGTQRFQQTYYKQSGNPLLPGSMVTESVNAFNVLAYEFSMPAIFAKNRILVMVNPAYIMPRNLIVVPGRPDISERGKDMMYATFTVKYTL